MMIFNLNHMYCRFKIKFKQGLKRFEIWSILKTSHLGKASKIKKIKSMEFSITGRGGSAPFNPFLFFFFLKLKWQFSVKFEGFLNCFSFKSNPIIPKNSFENIQFECLYTHFSLGQNVSNHVKKQCKFYPCMLKIKL